MKRVKIILCFIALSGGILGAFATTTNAHKARKKMSGYTEWFGISTDATGSHFHWTTTPPGDGWVCTQVDNDTSCDVYVDNSYTPVDDTPIPLQYILFSANGQSLYFN